MDTISLVGEADRAPQVPGARLIVVFSCNTPTSPRQPKGWRANSIELGGVDRVQICREGTHVRWVRARSERMLMIPDGQMSFGHAYLEYVEGRWVVCDRGSKNGTWVNGERVSRKLLEDNDVISMGATILLFRAAPPSGSMPMSRPGANTRTGPEAELDTPDTDELLTLNPTLAGVIGTLRRLARSRSSVLLFGETGVGKEVFARATHRLSGRPGEFVGVNCGAIPPHLIASELFGVERGAFTGASRSRQGLIRRAHGGTLFLDEIADLPITAQTYLLRVLQEREVAPVGGSSPVPVDIRVIAATHQDLQACVQRGTFRQDLLARLRGRVIRLPPLRERREDIGLLIANILARFDHKDSRPLRFSWEAGTQLFVYHWPDNIRELVNALETAIALTDDGEIRQEHLPEAVVEARCGVSDHPMAHHLRALIREHKGKQTAIARAMGTSRSQLQRLLKRHGIEVKR